MTAPSAFAPKTALGRAVATIEETLIAVFLGLMTIVTFANVVARYIFNSNILWALETTVFLFAWMVLIGASYCVRVNAHLGVDVFVNLFSPAIRKFLALVSAALCLSFVVLLLIGSWNYWAPFAGLSVFDPQSVAFVTTRDQAWYEVNDIPLPEFLRWLEGAMNQGEEYEKLPRFIPYAVLPFALALLLWRFLEAAWMIWTGQKVMLIASHEAEDMMAEVRDGASDKAEVER